MKHKHAEVIKAWADGAEIEYKYISSFTNTWTEWKAKNNDGWIEKTITSTASSQSLNLMLCMNYQ